MAGNNVIHMTAKNNLALGSKLKKVKYGDQKYFNLKKPSTDGAKKEAATLKVLTKSPTGTAEKTLMLLRKELANFIQQRLKLRLVSKLS